METLDCIRSRRSIRSYRSDPLPPELIRRILDAGRHAPSAANLQPWRFLLLSSKNWLDKVHAAYPHSWFMDAPHVLVVKGCKNTGWVRPADNRSFLESDVSIALACMVLAAWSEGVGTCWIANFEPDVLAKNLGLGPEEAVYGITPLGWPADHHGKPVNSTTRRSYDDVVLEL